MLLEASENTGETEDCYEIEYTIMQHTEMGENGKYTAYGIACRLYKKGYVVDSEVLQNITAKKQRIEKFYEILSRNKVFPVHLRDVVEDLLFLELE